MEPKTIGNASRGIKAISRPRRDTILGVMSIVSGVTPKQMVGPVRRRPIARARQVAYWLMMMSGYSSTSVGAVFNRDHTTVLHGAHLIERLRSNHDAARHATDALLSCCRNVPLMEGATETLAASW